MVLALKKIKTKLDLLTDIDMLLMVGISSAMYHAIYQNVKDNNNKSMKDYDKTKNHHNYIKYLTS